MANGFNFCPALICFPAGTPVTTDQGEFIIPIQCEGDIKVGSNEFGIISVFNTKKTRNTCNSALTYEYEDISFLIFDRNYLEKSTLYEPSYAVCNDIE